MKKTILVLVLCGLCSFLRAQQSITFTIEKLSKPEHLLHTSPQDQIYRNLIDESAKAQYMSYKDTLLPSGILATNPKVTDKAVKIANNVSSFVFLFCILNYSKFI